jgi:hypothetical protein
MRCCDFGTSRLRAAAGAEWLGTPRGNCDHPGEWSMGSTNGGFLRVELYLFYFSPPARWGSLDFISQRIDMTVEVICHVIGGLSPTAALAMSGRMFPRAPCFDRQGVTVQMAPHLLSPSGMLVLPSIWLEIYPLFTGHTRCHYPIPGSIKQLRPFRIPVLKFHQRYTS